MKVKRRLLALIPAFLVGIAACGSDGSLGSPESLPPLPPIIAGTTSVAVATTLVVGPPTTLAPVSTPPPQVILPAPTAPLVAPTVAPLIPDPQTTTTVPAAPAPTAPPAPPAAPPANPPGAPIETGCVRSNIDFAAVRQAPGVTNPEVGRIPPATCGVQIFAEGSDGRIAWIQVGVGDIVGWSAKSNFDQTTLQPA